MVEAPSSLPGHEPRLREGHVFLILSMCLLTVVTREAARMLALYVVLALILLSAGVISLHRTPGRLATTWGLRPEVGIIVLAAALVTVGALDVHLIPVPGGTNTDPIGWWMSAAWGGLLLVAIIVTRTGREPGTKTVLAMAILFAAVGGAMTIQATPQPPIDVFELHDAAAKAMVNGLNPYTPAVQVEDGSPTAAPGSLITGYPYPPVTALAYGAAVWIADDSRWASLVGWLGFLAVMAALVVKADVRRRPIALGLFLVVAVQPGWLFVLEMAWTEPVSLALMAAAVLWWDRPIVLGAIGLGLAVASKQYFLVVIPVIALARTGRSFRRFLASGLVAAATVLPFVAIDPAAFWEAVVAFPANVPPRPDGSNLTGLLASLGVSWKAPAVLSLGLPTALAGWLGYHARSRGAVTVVVAAVLSAFFMLASQAFANYWFLVSGLLAMGLLADWVDGEPGVTKAGRRDERAVPVGDQRPR